MKRLIVLLSLVCVSVAMGGCVRGNDSYRELQQVAGGINIHYYTQLQSDLALQPANVALRLAVLLAEGELQRPAGGESFDPLAVQWRGEPVRRLLFGSTTGISATEEGYRVLCTPTRPLPGGFPLDGSLGLNTGGRLLDATTAETPWTLGAAKFSVQLSSTHGTQTIRWNGGTMRLYADGTGGYVVELAGIDLNIDRVERHSTWSGSLRLRPTGGGLAYSLCAESDFRVSAAMDGPSLISFDGGRSATRLAYELLDGLYRSHGELFSGELRCRLSGSGDYDRVAYPSPEVRILRSYDEQAGLLTQTIEYDGYTYTQTF